MDGCGQRMLIAAPNREVEEVNLKPLKPLSTSNILKLPLFHVFRTRLFDMGLAFLFSSGVVFLRVQGLSLSLFSNWNLGEPTRIVTHTHISVMLEKNLTG